MRATAQDTRGRIRQVALELFTAQGFQRTSLREIAAHLGFSKAALYYHYPSKDLLLRDLLEPPFSELTKMVEALEQLPFTPARTRRLVEGTLDVLVRHAPLFRFLHQDQTPLAKAELRGLGLTSFERLRALMEGPAPSDADRVRTASALAALRVAATPWLLRDVPAEVLRATLLEVLGATLRLPPRD